MEKASMPEEEKPRKKTGKKVHPVQQGTNTEISAGNLSNSAVIVGDRNNVTINATDEQGRRIASELVKVNELLEQGQIKKARETLAKIESLGVEFPGLKEAGEKTQATINKQKLKQLMYGGIAAVFIFLASLTLIKNNREMRCESGKDYYLKGVLAVTRQEAEGQTKLWVGSSGNGLTIRNENGKIEKSFGKADLKSSSVIVIEPDEQRNGMWVGTGGGGLAFIDSSLQVKHRFTRGEQIPGCVVTGVLVTDQGIYITTISGKGMGFSKNGETWETLPIPKDYEEKNLFDIFSMAADPDGSVWVGTYQDLYQRVGENWKHYQPVENQAVTVRAIAVDGDSVKWVGTLDGLYLLDTRSGTRWSRLFTTQDGLASNYVVDVAIVDVDSAIVGTTNGISFCWKIGGGLDIKCQIEHADMNLGRINSITVSPDGRVVHLGSEANDPIKIPIK